jgi:hypothetical protein
MAWWLLLNAGRYTQAADGSRRARFRAPGFADFALLHGIVVQHRVCRDEHIQNLEYVCIQLRHNPPNND